MKRLNRTQQMLARYCTELRRGLDATELATLTGTARHNVSADLNQLWRDGLAVKLSGRPVLFWDRGVYQQLQGQGTVVPDSHQAPVQPVRSEAPADPLARLIGAQESLRSQVEQARAAVLYPPHGLHTLLVGPTGAGKSVMAERMHAFGVFSGRLPPASPFITLNCADYANNAQLLMAHLFGALKGAYTGADRDREGLVDQADGGILFLDEVHRLPAEGQEMLFRLIDKGLYRRLGETGAERKAQVMLIAATTEKVDSALLRTFTRRIPMVITMPSLAERTARERFRLIRRFAQAEATKIGIDLVVPQDSLRMLLEYECLGNIGQLHNDVQLACARLFLSYLTHGREPMEMVAAHLPEHIHRTVPPARQRSPEIDDLLRSTGGQLVITKKPRQSETEPSNGPISFYGLLERQMQELQERGLDSAEAERVVQHNIESHFRDFVEQVRHRHQVQRQELSKLVGQPILRAVERAVLWAEDRLGRAIPERILYALALHVHASLERLEAGRGMDHLIHIPIDDSPEARVAAGVVDLLARELGCVLPACDVAFVAMLLGPDAAESLPKDQVGVVVVAHGRVASAMVEVAHALAGVTLADAVDMPLDQEPAVIQEQLVEMARGGRFPGGLLLLVDMGSLEAMGEVVTHRTGVQVRTLGMVSTGLVVEAVHQAGIPGATLDQIYQSVLTARGAMLGRDSMVGLPLVILTFCYTGVGGAHTLARIVKEGLRSLAQRVDVIPASIAAGAGWTRLIATLVQSHRLLAVVGPVNPCIPGVTYVSTEEMVVGSGTQRLRRLVEDGTCSSELPAATVQLPTDPVATFGKMALSLGEHLKVTNPAATVPVIAKGLHAIEHYLGTPLSHHLRVGLMMHLVCLVERKVRERLDSGGPVLERPVAHQGSLPWLPDTLREVTDMFHIRFSATELARLDEIISHSVSAGTNVSS